MAKLSRRGVARGALWSVPTIAIASASPAIAASCTPSTVDTAAAVAWTSHQTSYDGGDTETHYVNYSFTNNGPAEMPAGVKFTIRLTYDVYSGVASDTSSTVTSGSAAVNVVKNGPTDNGDGTDHYVYDIEVITQKAIANGDAFTLTVTAVYGALTGDVKEEVLADSPVEVYSAATCVTTVTTVTVTGSSDGTSYTSP